MDIGEKLYPHIFDQLRQSRYTKHISDKSLEKLLIYSDFRCYMKNRVIIRQGEINHHLFVLVSGAITVKVDGNYIYTLRRNGDIFGEMSLITGNPSSAHVETCEDSDVIAISAEVLKQVSSEDETLIEDSQVEIRLILHEWFSRILSEKLFLTSEKAKLYEGLSQRLKKDLDNAKKVQEEVFYSNLQNIPGFQLHLKSEFASELGGDLFGIFHVKKHLYGILLGDVTGHGTASALLALSTWNVFHDEALHVEHPLKTITAVNASSLKYMPDNYFITAFYGVYDSSSHELRYVNAGHHPGILIRNETITTIPVAKGLPLGVFPSEMCNYHEFSLQLQSGDRLVLCTDGVFEYMQSKNVNGYNRLISILEEHQHLPSETLKDFLYEYGKKLLSDKQYEDDFTLMIFDVA
ncbi:MAG: SpoIIE family protein phosphatase [SAR324 cluster bacterium]|nr:SpoIIE family protein phosphatase [SAR324 cluster bacterium]